MIKSAGGAALPHNQGPMKKPTNRDKLLEEGLKVIHERGYRGASVRDIVHAAGVPQGSFTNHFDSKEAFTLEVLERYHAGSVEIAGRSLENAALMPLDRLRAYVAETKERIKRDGIGNGCLYGNLSAEAGDHSERIRQRLEEIYGDARDAVRDSIEAAVTDGSLPAGFESAQTASFVISGLQGAILLAKTHRDIAPIDHFETILFDGVLVRNHRLP